MTIPQTGSLVRRIHGYFFRYFCPDTTLAIIVFDVKGFYWNILRASFLLKYLSIFIIKLNGTTAYGLFGKKEVVVYNFGLQ